MTTEESKAYRTNRNNATRKAYVALSSKYADEFKALRSEFGFSLKEKVLKAKDVKVTKKAEGKKEVKAEKKG